ncbi:MAG: ATP synthase F1 subunit epsilon [Endomicrobium sp.]|jgi:F-type H+-transporting ATPase subunit epsilon|nr:ATP synthase F1 subunit epsilon [Endomicrobium sp.]
MNVLALEILSPEGSAFKGNVYSVSLPTLAGIIEVLPGHTNLVSKLKRGEIIIRLGDGAETKKIAVTGGFAEISQNAVNIVAEFAIISDDENRHKFEEAVKLAASIKANKKDAQNSAAIEMQLKKAASELKSNAPIKRKKR